MMPVKAAVADEVRAGEGGVRGFYTLEVTQIAHGGEGIGRVQGKVVFVPYCIPGETVLVEVVEERKKWARARLVEVQRPSEDRISPPCPYYGHCGGCHFQHVRYERQLAFKEEVVRGQMARLGGMVDAPVGPTLSVGDPWRYRNHVQLAVDREGRLGFREARGRGVVPIEACLLMHPLLAETFDALELEGGEAGEGHEEPTLIRRISLRAGVGTGERMVIFETYGDAPLELAVDIPLSCVLLRSDGVPVVLAGSDYFYEVVGGRRYRISASSFFQVNTAGAEVLTGLVREMLAPAPSHRLLDLYCGVGLFGLALAGDVAQVVGVEENPMAVRDARLNAAELPHVQILEGAAEEVVPTLSEPFDLAVVDPPRDGLAPEAISLLARQPVSRLAYVSCDPATLARDARKLRRAGYRLVQVQPVDLFPQTYHVETVALWEGR
ncbi:MAG: class I SAM-dependent RNA methyltransferase [Anaerolineae bacterium]